MNFLGFMLFSTIENLAFYFLILILFRFDVKESILKFALLAIVQSLVSNSLQIESLQAVSALLQAVIVIFFVSFVLRIHVFNALIMVITGYVINYVVQWIIIMTVIHFTGSDEIVPYTPKAFIIQGISALTILSISIFTNFTKGGFSFIDHQSRSTRSKIFIKENRPLVILITFSVALTFIANVLIFNQNTPYLLISILLFIVLIGLLYICLKRDASNNG